MRMWRGIRLGFKLITDSELYFLLWLAVGNLFRRPDDGVPTSRPLPKKRSKAMAAK
jgi:hypothetical protein